MTDLGTLGGNTGGAQAINASGQVAGNSTVAFSQPHATLWDNGVITDLTPGVSGTNATAINDARQVVGNVNYSTAFLWDNGTITNLGDLASEWPLPVTSTMRDRSSARPPPTTPRRSGLWRTPSSGRTA